MTHPYRCAVIGLGSMGFGMASSLLRAGHEVWGFDVQMERVALFSSEGGKFDPMATIAPELDAVICVVLNAAQTEEALFGSDGAVPGLAPGAVVLGCATVPPEFARQMAARCADHDVLYLDAPISGGAAKAAAGTLSIMASGAPDAIERAQPVLDAMSEQVFDLGTEPGTGSAMKATNQLLAGVHIAAMAEALTFGMTQGITPETFLKVIPNCAGTSWMLENRAPHVVQGDYSAKSAVNIWPKDLGIVLEAAEQAGFDAPMTTTAITQFCRAAENGFGNEDDAAVAKVYAAQAGLQLPNEKKR